MDAHEWDVEVLKDIFNHEDVSRILKIPLSFSNQEDKWLWLEDEKGHYSVKSGYRILNKLSNNFSTASLSFKWLKLWNLAIPPKIKNFMWRVLQDCIPTLENLRKKFVDVHPICQVCKREVETLYHALVTCQCSYRCWEISTLRLDFFAGNSVQEVIVKFFDSSSTKDLEILCSIMWSIWNHRNLVVWNSRFKTPPLVTNEASSTLFQWQQAQVTMNRQSSCFAREGLMVWQPPPLEWVSCNMDAAFSAENGKSSYGCILRNESGDFVAGRGGVLANAIDVRIAEALAFREALSWLKKMDRSKVYIELDSLNVVEAVRTKGKDDSFFGSIIADCLVLLRDLRSHYVYFIRRLANVAAHSIARVAHSMSGHEEWDVVPSFLEDVLAHDLNY